jgi:hypothetical protein
MLFFNLAHAQQSNFVGGSHRQLVLFTGFDLNDCTSIQSFLQRDLSFNASDKNSSHSRNLSNMGFLKGAIGKKPTPLIVSFYRNTKDSSNRFIIQKVVIKGSFNDVAEVFISYWDNVPIKWEDLKEKPAVMKINLTDQFVFKNELNGMATITVLDNRPKK